MVVRGVPARRQACCLAGVIALLMCLLDHGASERRIDVADRGALDALRD
jgi:hypothetical protein